MGLNIFDTVLL